MQVLYPDDFNYAAVACPDPIAFTSYTTVDLYEDKNAYYYDSPFKKTARPGYRDHYSGTAVVPGTSTVTYGSPKGQVTRCSHCHPHRLLHHRHLHLNPPFPPDDGDD